MSTVSRWRWGDSLAILEEVLAGGGIVAIPTESSYALAVDPRDAAGVEAVVALKGRESTKPLPVVVADREQLKTLAVRPSQPALALTHFWPAPLSIVLATEGAWPAAAGATSLAVRMPAHERLRKLLGALRRPLTATSANRSGQASLTDPAAVASLLGGPGARPAALVDEGILAGGAPSTLVAVEPGGVIRILRRGAFDPALLPDRISAAVVENPVDAVGSEHVFRGDERNA